MDIENKQTEEEFKILNPFFLSVDDFMKTNDEIHKITFSRTIFVSLQANYCKNKDDILKIIQKKYLDREDMFNMLNIVNFTITPPIGKNTSFEPYIKIMKYEDFSKILCLENIKHNEYECIVLMINMNNYQLDILLSNFDIMPTTHMYIENKQLCDYFDVEINCDKLRLDDSSYWKINYNVNLDSSFENRNIFRIKTSTMPVIHSDDTVTSLIDRALYEPNIYELPNLDVYGSIKTKPNYVDLKEIDIYPHESIDDNYNELYTKSTVYNLIESIHNPKELIKLFAHFATNPRYYKYIINNKTYLDKYSTYFKEYPLIFSYIFSWSWLMFYNEECKYGNMISTNDLCIFDLDTASKLPKFIFAQHDPHGSPYFSLLISKKKLDISENMISLPVYYNNDAEILSGLCNLNEFKDRFKIFCGSNLYDFINKLNFKSLELAITGSVMTACCQKNSPLLSNYSGEHAFMKMIDEHYHKSDIDIMCKTSSIFDFLSKINIIIDTLNELPHEYILKEYRSATMTITTELLEILVGDKIYDVVNIEKYKSILYIVYLNRKIKTTNKMKTLHPSTEHNKFYNLCYYDNIDMERMSIKISPDLPFLKEDEDMEILTYDEIIPILSTIVSDEINEKFKNIKHKRITACVIKENIKFKLSSYEFKHSLEIFGINKTYLKPSSLFPRDDFISTVSQFHLPNVRAYYIKDKNVYCTPSFITSMMTQLLIDVKYITETQNKFDIILKAFSRGFGTILNKTELELINKYVKENDKWKTYEGSIIGTIMTPKSHYFRPKIITEKLKEDNYAIFTHKAIITEKDLINYYDSIDHSLDTFSFKYQALRAINSNGTTNIYNDKIIQILLDEYVKLK
jgi:hypothetical protein